MSSRSKGPAARRALSGLLAAICACAMPGCAVGPDFKRPPPPPVERYNVDAVTQAGGDGSPLQRFTMDASLAPDWWRMFGSERLNAVVAEGLANSPSLQAAEANLSQSQANLRAGYGVFFPQADAAFGVDRQRYSPEKVGQDLPATIFSLFTLSASVSYALDVFGGERRAVEELQAQVEAQGDAVKAAYLTLTCNIVNAEIADAAYADEIEATRQVIAAQKETVRLTEVDEQAGTASYASVLSARGQLAASQASLPPLLQKRDQARDLLAALLGHVPAQWQPPQIDLAELSLPEDVPLSLPSDLVRRRPDILLAEAQLHGASAAVGVATAAQFPSFTLSATYGANNTATENLFSTASRFWGVGAGVATPLFEGGTLWFQRKAAMAAYRRFEASYRQTVLGAFDQVADSLKGLQHDADAEAAQGLALDSARQARTLADASYQAGVMSYSQSLAAETVYQQARIADLQARALRLQDTVALFAALGGGWSRNPEPAKSMGDAGS